MVDDQKLVVERVQTGVRIEKRILKVLKAFAEYHDMTLKKFYELDLDSSASHRLKEIKGRAARKRAAEK
jgi:hypothetical protein